MPVNSINDTPETLRREVFQALVEEQDKAVGVARSRRLIADRFGLSESQIRLIEQEGIDHEWPPL
jgi:hypothetical protein